MFTVPEEKIKFYREHGWVVLEDVIGSEELEFYRKTLDEMLDGKIDCSRNRSDLGGHTDRVDQKIENIVQITWPTDLTSVLDECEFMRKARVISDQLYGDAPSTWAIDTNQFLTKAPHTATPTPWHQDQSYYIDLPDGRAANFWLALEEASVDQGCLWFEDSPLDTPLALRKHWPAGNRKGAMQCDGDEANGTPAPLKPGSLTVHSHLTPHYARGNTTDKRRIGFIMQTRPAISVQHARRRGFDHGRMAGNNPESRLDRQPKAA